MKRRPLFCACVGACVACAISARAAEPSKKTCIAANETGQDLRRAGKLREARERFELCSAISCPAVVRDDCVQRLAETKRAQPTVVFVAKNARNDAVARTRISVDGAPPAALEGSPITLEPGEHHFEIVADGYTAAWKTLSMPEGFHAREEIVLSPTQATTADSLPNAESGGSRRIVAYGLGGAGLAALAAGSFFGIEAYSDFHSAKSRCVGGNVDACPHDAVQDGDKAGSWADISTALFIAGAVLVSGGAYFLLTSSSRGSNASLASACFGRW